MGYNVSDIIEKALKIAIKRKAIYETIGHENCSDISFRTISKILVKELNKTIGFYEMLLKEVSDVEFEEIDFYTYDKMSSLISDFNNRVKTVDLNNGGDFWEYSLGLEKAVYSLLVDIQGRFINNTSDVHTKTYKILSEMITNKAEQIAMMEKV
jgi:hypothetical protein